MRKKCLILVLIICLFFTSSVQAKNYSKFTIYATFNGVDKSTIPGVYVAYGFIETEETQEPKVVELTPENNFTYVSTDTPLKKIFYDTASVKNDVLGKYDIDASLTLNGDDELFINVVVGTFVPQPLTDATTTADVYPSSFVEDTTKNEIEVEKEQKEKKKEEKEKTANYAAIIVYSLLVGVVVLAIIIFVIKAKKASNFY